MKLREKPKRESRKRELNSPTNPKPSKRRSRKNSEADSTMSSFCVDEPVTAEVLAMKLKSAIPELLKRGLAKDCPDLKEFDIDHDMEDFEKITTLRDKLKKKMEHFDSDGRTDVNFDYAAIAGAKVVMDERPATRNMTKKLAKEAGITEDVLLYEPLPREHVESHVAKNLAERRQESIVESFVDFQKQLKFKKDVLENVAKKIKMMEYSPPVRRASAAARLDGMVTPQKKKFRKAMTSAHATPKKVRRPANPLEFSKIMDNYADMLASEIKDRSINFQRIVPIPLDLDNEENAPGY